MINNDINTGTMSHDRRPEIITGKDVHFGFDDLNEEFQILEQNDQEWKVLFQQKIYNVVIKHRDADGKNFVMNISGWDIPVRINEGIDQIISQLGFLTKSAGNIDAVKAPMPGLVVDLFVSEGDVVARDQKLLSLEAMKMENIIKSPGEGKVKKIHVQKGSTVEKNQLLLLFE